MNHLMNLNDIKIFAKNKKELKLFESIAKILELNLMLKNVPYCLWEIKKETAKGIELLKESGH